MSARRCVVSFADTEGLLIHTVWAESVYETAALARQHILTVNKLMQWLKGG